MSEVKVFRVEGIALFSPNKLREWQVFRIDVRALTKEHAVEKVLSELGSRHKLKRSHIRILKVRKIKPVESKSKFIKQLESLRGWYFE